MKKLILCDFDGTISIEDTGYALLEHFSAGDWEAIDREFCEGKIGSREAYAQIAEILRGDESSIRRFLQQHSKIDSHFLPFYQACRQAGIDVKIVSDGLDFYIRTILKTHHLSDIPFYANHAHFVKGKEMAITFPYANDECGRCGTCKRGWLSFTGKSTIPFFLWAMVSLTGAQPGKRILSLPRIPCTPIASIRRSLAISSSILAIF